MGNPILKISLPGVFSGQELTQKDIYEIVSSPLSNWRSDGSLTYVDEAEGTEIRLVIVPCSDSRFVLKYDLIANGNDRCYFSLGASDKLNQYFEHDDDEYMIEGFLIDGSHAEYALLDFVQSKGCLLYTSDAADD